MDERYIRQLIRSELANFFGMAPLTTVDESQAPIDQIQLAAPEEGIDNTADAQRMEAFGDVCMPPRGAMCIVFWSNQGCAHLPLAGPRYRPGGFKEGDRALYCAAPSTLVHLRAADGALLLQSGTPQGGTQGDVAVNGGTKRVAREEDPVKPTAAMKRVLAGLIGVVNGIAPGTITPADQVETQVSVGVINGGADHFKA